MVPLNFAVAALLPLSHGCWPNVPSGCGPMSHSCTTLAKSYNIPGVFPLIFWLCIAE